MTPLTVFVKEGYIVIYTYINKVISGITCILFLIIRKTSGRFLQLPFIALDTYYPLYTCTLLYK